MLEHGVREFVGTGKITEDVKPTIYEIARPDGERRIIETFSFPIKTEQGFLGCSIMHDLTETKKAQEELERHHQHLEELVEERTAELEAFAYSISHDLRAPLRAMSGFADALREDYGDKLDERGADYAKRIQAASKRMDLLIHDILTYSRISNKDLELEEVDLQEIVDEVLGQLEKDIQDREVEIEIKKTLPKVTGFRPILSQVILNLLSNAIKFSKPEGTPVVKVWAEETRDSYKVYVEDNGIGIPKKYRERIFHIFERLHAMDEYPGTGIGLAIVKKGMERMKGGVGLDSKPGKGSKFWIELQKNT
jgi:light-regulated signal transduction histidine kinase (bacteriophytochrome)